MPLYMLSGVYICALCSYTVFGSEVSVWTVVAVVSFPISFLKQCVSVVQVVACLNIGTRCPRHHSEGTQISHEENGSRARARYAWNWRRAGKIYTYVRMAGTRDYYSSSYDLPGGKLAKLVQMALGESAVALA